MDSQSTHKTYIGLHIFLSYVHVSLTSALWNEFCRLQSKIVGFWWPNTMKREYETGPLLNILTTKFLTPNKNVWVLGLVLLHWLPKRGPGQPKWFSLYQQFFPHKRGGPSKPPLQWEDLCFLSVCPSSSLTHGL